MEALLFALAAQGKFAPGALNDQQIMHFRFPGVHFVFQKGYFDENC